MRKNFNLGFIKFILNFMSIKNENLLKIYNI